MTDCLQVAELHKTFGGVAAVDGVSLSVGNGETVAVIGPNGAGKSTLFNLIGGQLRADAGSISLFGRQVGRYSPQKRFRLGLARTFQMAEIFASMTALENVQTALTIHARQEFSLRPLATTLFRSEAEALLERCGLSDLGGKPVADLAYGDVKRVELAMALSSGPKFMLMDEPTAGMTADEKIPLMDLVRRIGDDTGMAVLFTEHDMGMVFAYADRIAVLARGRLIAEGSVNEIRADPQVRNSYLGSVSLLPEAR